MKSNGMLTIDPYPVDVFAYLEDTLSKRIAFLDGAMGTMVQVLKLQEVDFRGKQWLFLNNNN